MLQGEKKEMSLAQFNFLDSWPTTLLFSIAVSMVLAFMLYGIFVIEPERQQEQEDVRDMSCGELKDYVLEDGRFKSIAKEVFIWRCEK